MATNSWIGIANGIGFKHHSGGGISPSDILDALLLEKGGAILLENGNYIKLEKRPSKVKSVKNNNIYGNSRK